MDTVYDLGIPHPVTPYSKLIVNAAITGMVPTKKDTEHIPISVDEIIADATACVVVLSKETKYYLEDGAAATTSMLIAATGLGLAACWVAGDKKSYQPAVLERIGAPSDVRLISLIALGYSDERPSPAKRLLDDVLHWEKY